MARATNIDDFFYLDEEGHYGTRMLIEGDSWTHHPQVNNLCGQIEEFKSHDYLMLNLSTVGDTATEIFDTSGKQVKKLKKLLGNSRWGPSEGFHLIVFSAGGNDIVGDDLKTNGYVIPWTEAGNRRGEKLLTEEFDEQVEKVANHYRGILEFIRNSELNSDTPVITHGYSYLKPRRVGTHLGPFSFSDGWVKKHLDDVYGIPDRFQYDLVCAMLDRFYEALSELESEFDRFLVADTRRVLLKNGKPDLRLWHDEIHPNSRGFRRVAEALRSQATTKGLWVD